MYKSIPGTRDILPDEVFLWQEVEDISRGVFARYNYKECRPPLIEEAALFDRSLGESSEIVQKQMFLIKNKEELYCLRPEATASIIRAYIENSLDKTKGFLKLYYMGPMFRLERPQKGRLRQFYHIGCEAIGSEAPELDAEVIALADNLLKSFSIDNYTLKINSLGCSKDRSGLTEGLRDALKPELSNLCEDCHLRFKKNILRILDCKNESCRKVIEKINISDRHLCPECKEHFSLVKFGLDNLGICYEITPRLVRGLDYYTRTVFEISHQDLGSQDALGAGGRYDNLVKELGGPQLGAVGFAFGVERLLLVTKLEGRKAAGEKLVYAISLGDKAKAHSQKLLANLRRNGITCDTDYENKSLKGAMRKANDLKARLVLILGEDELRDNTVTLKDMLSGQQKQVLRDKLIEEIGKAIC
ncbi:MAG: histidine--tRNA ligase [Candidatus Omnitrophota bacterium]